MPYKRKYHGPCPEHTQLYNTRCGHCHSWRVEVSRQSMPHDVPIFRQLHWPAPGAHL